ncbi:MULTISPECIES: TIGR00366 family protein [unclassified Caballeronia]|uniref:short-chain fatty acid transporter n=1 Tax=unclassified Caballeronia TaxID=2646786 RepID=UPI0028650521|nr:MULTISPECIES: TIGR00366 family protein [unclassified Caballeronia]MDR5817036.1 TIGR00366 family protein [Caballeronia sp. LZ033]MDR5823943.1 TIGR00366 family protein [Caballeronia sp. LZ043]
MEQVTRTKALRPEGGPGNLMERMAANVTRWAEAWFPDAYIFAAVAVIVVAIGALAVGAPAQRVGIAFGDGFWSLIPFTMQMAIVAISGYVVAVSPPASKMIAALARLPKTARGAVMFVAFISIATSLFNWAISLVFSGLLVRALARRTDMRMDYRAAGAAAYLGMGATWALGLSSAAAQLQANPDSLPKTLLAITGVIPFSETIFLPQSMLMVAVLMIASLLIAGFSAPVGERARTAADLGVSLDDIDLKMEKPTRPGEWLEYSPVVTVLLVALGLVWIGHEFTTRNPLLAISNLNTYNFVFILLGMLLNWRPRRFLNAVAKSVPSTAGVLIQFPLYGGIAFILTKAAAPGGLPLSEHLAHFFVAISSQASFPAVMGVYSAVLGFFVPSGGGKWIIEAPYVIEAAKALQVHLGWSVTVYNAAEALPNLINPFWMLPLLGVLGLRAKDVVGFTFTQLVIHTPLVVFMLWVLAPTLTYHAPVMP